MLNQWILIPEKIGSSSFWALKISLWRFHWENCQKLPKSQKLIFFDAVFFAETEIKLRNIWWYSNAANLPPNAANFIVNSKNTLFLEKNWNKLSVNHVNDTALWNKLPLWFKYHWPLVTLVTDNVLLLTINDGVHLLGPIHKNRGCVCKVQFLPKSNTAKHCKLAAIVIILEASVYHQKKRNGSSCFEHDCDWQLPLATYYGNRK